MGIFGFDIGQKPKIRRFNYTPMYYKPEADMEEIQRKRIQASFGKGEMPPQTSKELFRYRMKEQWGRPSYSDMNAKIRRKTITLLMILFLVVMVFFAL